MTALDLPNLITFDDYCNKIDKFLLKEHYDKMKLAFSIYDQNGDGFICINDTFDSLKNLGKFDYLL